MAPDDLMTDGPGNWVVAICCCFINLTFYGLSRLSGIMLVSTIQTFEVSRASAAVPFSLSTAVRNLAGVFVGQLGHRFGVGPVVAVGCVIASLGAGLCFFVQDMEWLSVCWGGIFGFGFGLSTCLLPLAINQNFVKHNGTASGISYSGAYLGSFIFPPVLVWLLDTFGFQGTFLIISASILHVLAAAILLRERKTAKKYAINKSSQKVICAGSYGDHGELSVICRQVECGDMWKQNINRAFLDSQGNLTPDKDNKLYRASIAVTNYPYLLQDHTFLKSSQGRENYSQWYVSNNRTLDYEIKIEHHKSLSNSLKNLKSEHTFSGSEELKENPLPQIISPSTYLFPLGKDCDSFETTKCSQVHSPKCPVTSVGGVAKEVPTISKMFFSKLFESRLLSRGKYKAKCKLKLQKLKRILETSLVKNRTPELNEFIQTETVKLASFRYLQSISCPTLPGAFIPSKCFHASMSNSDSHRQNVIDEQERCIRLRKSEIIPIEQVSAIREITGSCDVTQVRRETDIAPESKNSTTTSMKLLIPLDTNLKEKSNYEQSPVSYMYDNVSSKSSVSDEDSQSSSCKTEDSQFSSYVPTSSSELCLQAQTLDKRNSSKSRHKSYKSAGKAARGCCFDWIHMLKQPMFSLIGCTMSMHTLILVCVVTTIEDFAKDVGIPKSETYYALMALSISNLTGTLTLGSITDRGFISRHRFLSLCFFGMSLSLVALSLFAVSLISLVMLIVLYGLLESGVIITFPIVMKQFVKGERRQAVAIASSNMLSAPTVMLVPMLIGHFRDRIGSYSGLFYVLGATSFTCSLLWLVAPSICEKWCVKKKAVKDKMNAVC